MKRSNRLMLVLGVLLALMAFGGVLLFGAGSGNSQPAPPQTVAVVVAAADVTLGTPLAAAQLTTIQQPVADATDTYRDPNQIVGQVVRRTVRSGEAFRSTDFQSSGASGAQISAELKAGQVAMAVTLDGAASGIGSIIQPGDYVDVILAMEMADGKFPIVLVNPLFSSSAPSGGGGGSGGSGSGATDPFIKLDIAANTTSVKVLVQNVQVLGTLAAPVNPATASSSDNTTASAPATTGVILSMTAQQAELVRFTELDGHLSLLLRSPQDATAADVQTSGVTLRELVDEHGVLPPRLILSQFP